jgi:hypothetical protein
LISLLRRLFNVAHRFPWLLPAVSFAAGWLGFLLVRRGQELARIIALLALLGWLWLLLEPWVRRWLERRRKHVGNFVVNFVSQSLQQELLFFSLPFLIGSTHFDAGQIAFTSLVGVAALLSTTAGSRRSSCCRWCCSCRSSRHCRSRCWPSPVGCC